MNASNTAAGSIRAELETAYAAQTSKPQPYTQRILTMLEDAISTAHGINSNLEALEDRHFNGNVADLASGSKSAEPLPSSIEGQMSYLVDRLLGELQRARGTSSRLNDRI